MDVKQVLRELAIDRSVFHSEADFQHAFCWKARELLGMTPRLEIPIKGISKRGSLDALFVEPDGAIGIEFKYLTRELTTSTNGEDFALLNQSAQDIRRYDVVKDVARLEFAIHTGQIRQGYMVCLTNDPLHWSPGSRKGTADEYFKVHEGAVLSGICRWADHAGAGTVKGREMQVNLSGTYLCQWNPFSVLPGQRFGLFQSLVIDVSTPNPNPFLAGSTPPVISEPHISNSTTTQKTVSTTHRSSKYDPLRLHLEHSNLPILKMTFSEIEALVGKLPPSAYSYQAFWSNGSGTAFARSWIRAGYKAKVRISEETVVFARNDFH